MNRKIVYILFSDRTLLVIVAAILTVIIFSVTSLVYTRTLSEKNVQLKSQLTSLLAEKGEIIRLNADVTSKENKAAARRQAGIVSTLEKIIKGLEVEAMVIKSLGEKKVDEFTEENAELEIQEMDLNLAVNLLYHIDTSSVPMKIKNASIKTTFEDPDKFILKLTVSRLSK
ncbi:MAG: hypothetical protein ISR97_00270 [Nitrospira sp.]|nr:hypothetical protein [Nitrospira sp.]